MSKSCSHDFVKINGHDVAYAICCCMYCGQVRHVDYEGNITVTKQEGTIKWQNNT